MANIETDAAGRPIAYDSAGRPIATTTAHPVMVDGRPVGDTAYADRPVVVERRGGGAGWLIALLVLVALVVAAFALKLINIDQISSGAAPKIAVTGGELPKFKVDTAKIAVGTKKTEVETPTLHVEKADDAAKQ